ncbi:MAG: hypothetical protein O9972_41685 [Burkholderiales bacterium]|nr:hypothetical protein [Burkholderiales bacterium]
MTVVALALLMGAGLDAHAQGCRVPEVYLKMPGDLSRTVRLADRGTAVRIMVVGPRIGGPSFSEKKRNRLLQALEKKLPGMDFDLVDEGRGAVPAAKGFEAMREEFATIRPDLVLWQVGTPDALNHADPEALGRTLVQAAEWLRAQSIDLILIDPPFVPNVVHEPLYARIVGKIGEVSAQSNINLLRRYAATQHLDNERRKKPASDAVDAPPQQSCLPDLVAEAIYRAVMR